MNIMGIFTLKDKYILGYITAIWVYLCFRANHTSFSYANYDNILLSIIIFGGWYLICSYRTFVMTRGKLCKYYMETALEYVPYMKDGLVEKIFVKTETEDDWYELDYVLTIQQHCSLPQYNEFVRNNEKVSTLLKTMNSNAERGESKYIYKTLKSDYKAIKWLTFSVIIVCYIIIPLILTKI
jgi:hypothetical protein